jgi:aryl-alcohol dehydrogenase-like predicted oxidoreductase
LILGASKTQQLEENLKTIELYKKLEDEHMEKIEEILDNKPAHPPF